MGSTRALRWAGLSALVWLTTPLACSQSDSKDSPTSSSSAGVGGSAQGGARATGEGGGVGGVGGAGGGTGGNTVDPPPNLERYLTGNDADADVTPTGPGLILMGGGPDVDAAFAWWTPRVAGGDIVVLRTSGSDGYNDYLYDGGAVDSVETLLVTDGELADHPYVTERLTHAEGIFIAGGDQATYMTAWKNRGVETALMQAWQRGAVIGGTSAGCAVLGEVVFAAYNDTVYSNEALDDPYNRYMELDRNFLSFPPLANTVTDSHFAERDRMGRLLAFVSRSLEDGWLTTARGIGVDEGTALVVDAMANAAVLGSGAVYVLEPTGLPTQCTPGEPLEHDGVALTKLQAGDSINLTSGATTVASQPLAASGGVTIPAQPY